MDADLRKEIHDKCILNWNYRNLKSLPVELKEDGYHIEEIYLKYNEIERLPSWLGQLKNLTNLYLYGNQIKSLPDEICELESLLCLDVGQNHLVELPPSIGKLSQLNVLSATQNYLTYLPDDFCNLISLRVLILTGNMLSDLPECICNCTSLEELYLDENNLLCLPQQIVYLPKLKFLSIAGNKILYLPALRFLSSPRVSFERNRFLNYLTYCFASQLSNAVGPNHDLWKLETHGCCESNAPSEDIFRNLILQISRPVYPRRSYVQLVMPYGLSCVGSGMPGSKIIPSLYELSIRSVFKIFCIHKLYNEYRNGHLIATLSYHPTNDNLLKAVFIPQNLIKQLRKGPVSICSNPDCNTPIFSFATVWVIAKHVVNRVGDTREILCTLFFCSDQCSSRSDSYDTFQTSRMDWQVVSLD